MPVDLTKDVSISLHSTMGTSLMDLRWPNSTDLVGFDLLLQPLEEKSLADRYMTAIHAWFLQQISAINTEVATYLHDAADEKAFTLSLLKHHHHPVRSRIPLTPTKQYHLSIHLLSRPVVKTVLRWLRQAPKELAIRDATFRIRDCQVVLPPTSYNHLWKQSKAGSLQVSLQFNSPTTFQVKRQPLPFPLPRLLIQSYLRRWNQFSGRAYDVADYLAWVEQEFHLVDYRLETQTATVAKQGAVVGCVGHATYQLSAKALHDPEAVQLLQSLIKFSAYCGTGYKTAFGLGETQLLDRKPHHQTARAAERRVVLPVVPQHTLIERMSEELPIATPLATPIAPSSPPPLQDAHSLSEAVDSRLQTLTLLFLNQRKRQGGSRALAAAQRDAEIVLRSERGETLSEIAAVMDQTVSNVKTYLKRAKQRLRDSQQTPEEV